MTYPDSSEENSDLLTLYHALRERELQYFLVAKLPNKQDSEDILQELFLNISEMDDASLANVRQPKHYLFKMAANAVRTFYIKTKRLDEHIITGTENIPDFECPNSSPEALLTKEMQAESVLQAISSMPDKQRQTFLLYCYRNLKRAEIAKELDMKVSAVDKHLVRAFAYCKDWLADKE